jgi:hypothetical protein
MTYTLTLTFTDDDGQRFTTALPAGVTAEQYISNVVVHSVSAYEKGQAQVSAIEDIESSHVPIAPDVNFETPPVMRTEA